MFATDTSGFVPADAVVFWGPTLLCTLTLLF
jgi:hypothetical protein